MLSSRALQNVEQLERPFRFTPTPDYNPETNPQGLISFGMAENVSVLIKRSNRVTPLTIYQRPMRSEIVKYINDKVNICLSGTHHCFHDQVRGSYILLGYVHT
jgi:hypothetical protein